MCWIDMMAVQGDDISYILSDISYILSIVIIGSIK